MRPKRWLRKKTKNSVESYRYIITKGKHVTALNVITVRARVLRPQPAATAKDVEAAMTTWKSDIAYLQSLNEYTQDTGNEKAILMSILPEALQLVMKPHLTSTIEEFEKELLDHISFMDEQQRARRPIKAMTNGE